MMDLGLGFQMASGLIGQTRVTYQWARFEELDQWWHWALIACLVVFILTYVVLGIDATRWNKSAPLAGP